MSEGAIERFPGSTKEDYKGVAPGLVPQSVDDVLTIAKVYAASGLFPDVKNAAAAAVKILAGAEFGCTPVAAMNSFHIVKGKISMHYALIAARIKDSGKYRYKVIEKSLDACSLEFFEKEDGAWVSVGVETFTLEDAIAMHGLARMTAGDDNWFKIRRTMLFARCLTAGARFYCPEIFGGQPVYTQDEIEADAPARPVNVTDRGDEVMRRLTPEPAAPVAAPDVSPGGMDGMAWLIEDIGLSPAELGDFVAWCAGRELDPEETATKAKDPGGVSSVASLYGFLEGTPVQEPLL